MYHFFDNSTTVYEEYLIYDAISMIGSVGGTLGMCIGFSFTGIISFLMNILQHVISIIKRKLANDRDDTSYNMEGSVYLKSETYQKDKKIIEEKLNATNSVLMEYKKLFDEKTLKQSWL